MNTLVCSLCQFTNLCKYIYIVKHANKIALNYMGYDEILCNYRMNSVGRVQKTGNLTKHHCRLSAVKIALCRQ